MYAIIEIDSKKNQPFVYRQEEFMQPGGFWPLRGLPEFMEGVRASRPRLEWCMVMTSLFPTKHEVSVWLKSFSTPAKMA